MWEIPEDQIISYTDACKNFVENDDAFNNFKQDYHFKGILEHTNNDGALYYIQKISESVLKDKNLISKIKENDLYGNPEILSYEFFGKCSPSTIRYTKCLSDLISYFPELKLENVCEIGGGYGGLAKIVSCYYDFNSYTIFDLKEVNLLSGKYLNLFPELHGRVFHVDTNKIQDVKDVDLLISNYALSELSIDKQKEYYNKVIKNSKHIYITYNNPMDEFLEIVSKDFKIDIDYEPKTFGNVQNVGNNAIICGTKI